MKLEISKRTRVPMGSPTASHPVGVHPRLCVAVLLMQLAAGIQVAAQEPRWTARMDLGGNVPNDPALTELGGPISGERLRLDPGMQFDLAFGFRPLPWLEVGPELGFTFNSVDSFGRYSYPDTMLFQIPMMVNVLVEYPVNRPFTAFVGVGTGGVASFLTFGANGYYEPDGTGSDLVLAAQAFGGLRYRFGDNWTLGVIYRFLATDRQRWDVEWWTGDRFQVAADGLRMHSLCLEFHGRF